MIRRTCCAFLLLWLCVESQAFAQALRGPQEVVIYIHKDVENTDFVDPLICELSRVLVAPVRAEKSEMLIDLALLSPTGEFYAEKVIPRFHFSLPVEDIRNFNFLIMPYDLRSGQVRHTFGTIYGRPYNSGVVSLASLDPSKSGLPRGQVAHIVASRVYKVILRYIAHASGLWQREGCVLAWPHGVDALDNKPADFCEDDKAQLIEAHVIKEKPVGACNVVAMAAR